MCAECQERPTPFQVAAAPLAYEFPVDAAIRMLKFHRKLHYAAAFGEVLCGAAVDLPADIDALLPVPLHWLRHGVRGFNQAAEICRPLQRAGGLPVLRNVSRVRRTPYQSGLGARARRRNLAGAFAVRGTVRARHVLLIDDVITTGETCAQLARELLARAGRTQGQRAGAGTSLSVTATLDCMTDSLCVLVLLCAGGCKKQEHAWGYCWPCCALPSLRRKVTRSARSPKPKFRSGCR